MAKLTQSEIDQYRDDGYVIPAFRLDPARVDALRAQLDQLIQKNPGVRPEQLVNAHIDHPNAEGVKGAQAFLELAHDPQILDVVEGVLGEDIILWGCHMFCKPAGDGMEVPWHQDGEYWPIRPLANCTVWIALDHSQSDNGCLRVLPGSHREAKVFSHSADDREGLVLNYAIDDPDVNLDNAVDLELEPGQMSLHDVYMLHGSNPNNSNRRRAGIALRYMPATSVFERSIIKPSDDAGFAVDFSQRPIWLMRGQDKTGRNDFSVGH